MDKKNIAILILIVSVVGGFGFAYAQGRAAGKLKASVALLQADIKGFQDSLKVKAAADSARALLVAEQNQVQDSLIEDNRRWRRAAGFFRRGRDSLSIRIHQLAAHPESLPAPVLGALLDSLDRLDAATIHSLEAANDACEGALSACDSAKFVQTVQRQEDSLALDKAQLLLAESEKKVEELTDKAFPSFGLDLISISGADAVKMGIAGIGGYAFCRATSGSADAQITVNLPESQRRYGVAFQLRF